MYFQPALFPFGPQKGALYMQRAVCHLAARIDNNAYSPLENPTHQRISLIIFLFVFLDEGTGLRHRLQAFMGVAFYLRIQCVACLFNFRFYNTCSNGTSRSQ